MDYNKSLKNGTSSIDLHNTGVAWGKGAPGGPHPPEILKKKIIEVKIEW